ncbi:MAG: hypothetical protein IKU68_03610 [Oscillospiraceae bacterium]|nr:hypothetical protein [Oscillospiraceae bacterium]
MITAAFLLTLTLLTGRSKPQQELPVTEPTTEAATIPVTESAPAETEYDRICAPYAYIPCSQYE